MQNFLQALVTATTLFITASSTCLRSDHDTCVECSVGMHVFEGQCIQNIKNCISYVWGTDCLQCQNGFLFNSHNGRCEREKLSLSEKTEFGSQVGNQKIEELLHFITKEVINSSGQLTLIRNFVNRNSTQNGQYTLMLTDNQTIYLIILQDSPNQEQPIIIRSEGMTINGDEIQDSNGLDQVISEYIDANFLQQKQIEVINVSKLGFPLGQGIPFEVIILHLDEEQNYLTLDSFIVFMKSKKIPEIVCTDLKEVVKPTNQQITNISLNQSISIENLEAYLQEDLLFVQSCGPKGINQLQNIYYGSNKRQTVYQAHHIVFSQSIDKLILVFIQETHKNGNPTLQSVIRTPINQIVKITNEKGLQVKQYDNLKFVVSKLLYLKFVDPELIDKYVFTEIQYYNWLKNSAEATRYNLYFNSKDPGSHYSTKIIRFDVPVNQSYQQTIPSIYIPRQKYREVLKEQSLFPEIQSYDNIIKINEFNNEKDIQTLKYEVSSLKPYNLFLVTYRREGAIVKYRFNKGTMQYQKLQGIFEENNHQQKQQQGSDGPDTLKLLITFQKEGLKYIETYYKSEITANNLTLATIKDKQIQQRNQTIVIEGTFSYANTKKQSLQLIAEYNSETQQFQVVSQSRDYNVHDQLAYRQQKLQEFIRGEISAEIDQYGLKLKEFEAENQNIYHAMYENEDNYIRVDLQIDEETGALKIYIVQEQLQKQIRNDKPILDQQYNQINGQQIIDKIKTTIFQTYPGFISSDQQMFIGAQSTQVNQLSQVFNLTFYTFDKSETATFIVHYFVVSHQIDIRDVQFQPVTHLDQQVEQNQQTDEEVHQQSTEFDEKYVIENYPSLYSMFNRTLSYVGIPSYKVYQINGTQKSIELWLDNGLLLTLPLSLETQKLTIKQQPIRDSNISSNKISKSQIQSIIESNFSIDIGPIYSLKIKVKSFQRKYKDIVRRNLTISNILENGTQLYASYTYEQHKTINTRQISPIQLIIDHNIQSVEFGPIMPPNQHVIAPIKSILGPRFSLLSYHQSIQQIQIYKAYVKDFKFGNLQIIFELIDSSEKPKVHLIKILGYFSTGRSLDTLRIQGSRYIGVEDNIASSLNNIFKGLNVEGKDLIFWKTKDDGSLQLLEVFYEKDNKLIRGLGGINQNESFFLGVAQIYNKSIEASKQEVECPELDDYQYNVGFKKLMKSYGHFLRGSSIKSWTKSSNKDYPNSITYIVVYTAKVGYMKTKLIYFYQTNQVKIQYLNHVDNQVIQQSIGGCSQYDQQNHCVKCKDGLSLTLNQRCQPKISNCKVLEGPICLLCQQGYSQTANLSQCSDLTK